ncbi:hypothetical protein I553_2155 [Mycobacterium xenopi 4042]|uniref:Uncharacterized protein n=1 Tax=Mycobacterium xenopi 4042 TaxID=1299334 RepID=X8DJZ4_MYCXE|nr:hypothetical protein I553_2155 [Mycobacterium xenopi 4042]
MLLRRYEGVLDHIVLCAPAIGVEPERIQENLDALIALHRTVRH